jgi:hypothetical protein
MADIGQLLERGAAAVKAGRKEEAEQLLRQVVEEDPENEYGWLWLSAVVSGIDAQRECLHRVLDIDPLNPYARHGLAFLSRLRVGFEHRAAEAPWVDGVPVGEIEAPQRCPACGTVNPGWARSCSRCGRVLQQVDLVSSVRAEERLRTRSTASAGVIESWAGALAMRRDLAFEPEVELASPGRSLTGLILASLLLVLVRVFLQLVAGLLAGRSLPTIVRGMWPEQAEALGLLAGGALAASLVLGVVTAIPGRLAGGRQSHGLGAHFHLVAVAVSSWLAIAAIGLVVVAIPTLSVTGPASQRVLSVLSAVVEGGLFLYGVVLLIQAIQTAHHVPFIVGATTVGIFIAAGAVLWRLLESTLPNVQELVLRLWLLLTSPLTI